MESTNELVTKAEANAEGLSIESTNECITKAEFNANLPTPPQFSYNFPDNYREAIYIVNATDSTKSLTISTSSAGTSNSEPITISGKGVIVRAYPNYYSVTVTSSTNMTCVTNYAYNSATSTSNTFYVANTSRITNAGTTILQMSSLQSANLLATIYITE